MDPKDQQEFALTAGGVLTAPGYTQSCATICPKPMTTDMQSKDYLLDVDMQEYGMTVSRVKANVLYLSGARDTEKSLEVHDYYNSLSTFHMLELRQQGAKTWFDLLY